jgi:tRNA uridine 5-carboxymethylaminomethyl modification enzyme
VEAEIQRLRETRVNPAVLDAHVRERMALQRPDRHPSLLDLLRRPDVEYDALMALRDAQGAPLAGPGLADPAQAEQVGIQAKYAGYVDRQRDEIERQKAQADQAVPQDFDYAGVAGLSTEVRQRLEASRPATIGQAARISGVTPAAVSLLLVHLKRHARGRRAA